MPYLHCPACHQRAWMRGEPDRDASCQVCGSALGPHVEAEARTLRQIVRERFRRDARLTRDMPRFVRGPR
jgi:hypothetical protein